MAAAAAAAAAPTLAGGAPRPGHLSRPQEDRRKEEEGSDESEEEEEEVESDDGEGSESDVGCLADLCDPDAGSDEDPTFDPDADGDLEVEAVLRARMSRMSISARKGRKGSAALKMGKEETDLLAMVDKLMQDGQLEKLKVYECKAYLRMHKLRLTGKKEVLLNRIREHIEVKNNGEVKYPVSSFVLNCKGDACKGDIVMFEQNIYKRKKGAPRGVKGRLCGQRTNAGRIIKESYGTAKQQHTFTIEILWSKGYKPWPPLHPLLIKGRNLYKDRTMRQPWPDEEERNRVIQEKHERGFLARKSRAARIHEKETLARLNRMKDNKIKKQWDMNQKQPQEPQQKVESTNTVQQRVSGSKGPSFQNGGPQNTRQQHQSLKATSTHINELLPQKGGSTKTFKPELIDYQVSSIQHGGMQQKPLLNPTRTQQFVKNSSPHQSFQQRNDALTQEGAIRTHHVPSQHNKGSGNTSHHQISSKPTPIFKPQQVLKHQGYNQEDGSRKTYREQLSDHQNNTGHATEYDNSTFQPQGEFAQHASVHRHGSNYHQNAHGGQAHQPYRPRNQDQNSTYCDTEYTDSSFQPRGKFNQPANAYQRQSSSHKNAQVREPFRPRNQDFDSSDYFFGQDYDQGYYDYSYDQGYYDYSGMTRGQYHPQQSRYQNYYGSRPMTQGQYGTQQSHHQNYNGRRKMTQNQYDSRQNQPHQQFPEQRLQPRVCHYYYQEGWCRYGERCWYSHDI